jgi:polysaccharide biosynthesis protein PelG
MAGIGFELRKLLKRDTLLGLIQAYAYAGLISSGPWVLSIVGMLMIGIFSFAIVVPDALITQFQVTVTCMIAFTLIITGLFQLAFTRFIADRLFENRHELVPSNYHAMLLIVTVLVGLIVTLVAAFLFSETSLPYRLLLVAGTVVMANVWIATVFLSGMKQYKAILMLFAFGYSTSVCAALVLRPFGMEGLLAGYVFGQTLLFAGMQALITREFPSDRFISFELLNKRTLYPTLMAIGLLYNLGVWIDKFIFWYYPPTSQSAIGPLRASLIYDLPVFLAYLSIIPGMAIFLVRIETDFVEYYDGFYTAVRSGGSLESIERNRNGMVDTVRSGIYEMIKIQTIFALLVFVIGGRLMSWLQISDLYLPLFYVQTMAAGLQVIFLSILTVYFYLDRRKIVLVLTIVFVIANAALTVASLALGPEFYGYGFALSLMIVSVLGFATLTRTFASLEYSTFMLQ